MALLGFELLFRFMWGSLFVLSFVSRKETSERFPRIASYITLGSAFCAAYLLSVGTANIVSATSNELATNPGAGALDGASLFLDPRFWAIVAIYVGTFLYSHSQPRWSRIVGFLLYFGSCAGLLWHAPILEIVNFFTSSFVLGCVFAGQYLGHWFLTVPGMNLRELQKVVRMLFIALGLKTFEVLCSLALHQWVANIDVFGRPLGIDVSQTKNLPMLSAGNSFFSLDGDVWMGFGLFGFLLFLTRVLWGLIAPFILAIMIKKTVDMRSTQSATGILYALCVMIIVGEGAALYLRISMGLYL